MDTGKPNERNDAYRGWLLATATMGLAANPLPPFQSAAAGVGDATRSFHVDYAQEQIADLR